MLRSIRHTWNGNFINADIVLDASGLFAEIPTISVGDVYGATSCTISNACALSWSNEIANGRYPIGFAPIITSTFNVTGAGVSATLDDLSLGLDDGIGGSAESNGPTSGYIQTLILHKLLLPIFRLYSCLLLPGCWFWFIRTGEFCETT
ncbi:MAG: hypothetical protein QM500_01605 [Methylococcales bacterium]